MANGNRNLFNYKDANGQWQTLDKPGPTRISQHVILHPEQWTPQRTVDGVVCRNWVDHVCTMCGHVGHDTRRDVRVCYGQQCVTDFRGQSDDGERNRVEIRDAGCLGLGVFAKAEIHRNQLLGEYLGDLRSPMQDPGHDDIDNYYLTLADMAYITADEAGNWTRFINHSCRPNVSMEDGMYGRRRGIVFRAMRAIGPDEQLSVHYGDEFFTQSRMDCLCGAYEGLGPHQPGGAPAMFTGQATQ